MNVGRDPHNRSTKEWRKLSTDCGGSKDKERKTRLPAKRKRRRDGADVKHEKPKGGNQNERLADGPVTFRNP